MNAYWFCLNCKDKILPEEVTHQELHEYCGHQVVWISSPEKLEETINSIKGDCAAAIARIQLEAIQYIDLAIETINDINYKTFVSINDDRFCEVCYQVDCCEKNPDNSIYGDCKIAIRDWLNIETKKKENA